MTTPADCTMGPSAEERTEMQQGSSWKPDSASFRAAKARFETEGVIRIKSAVTESLADAAFESSQRDLALLEEEVAKQRQTLTQDQHHRAVRVHRCDFRELVKRDGGRLDMRYRVSDFPLNSPLFSLNPMWFPLVRELLGGGEVTLLYQGVMVARHSNSDDQKWHSDGDHLFRHAHSPPHCINVFVPLVKLVSSNGPTHFCPGTHRLGRFNEDTNRWGMCANKGDAILFDYRVKHRGGANSTKVDRPILYLCYSRPWFRDHGNTRSNISLVARGDPRYSNPWTARLLRGDAVSYLYQPPQLKEQKKQEGQQEQISGGSDTKRRRLEVTEDRQEEEDKEQEGAGEHWPLFEMNVELGDSVGASAGSNTIRVHDGDSPLELAVQFVQARGLPAEFAEPLSASISVQIEAAKSAS